MVAIFLQDSQAVHRPLEQGARCAPECVLQPARQVALQRLRDRPAQHELHELRDLPAQ